MQTCEVCPLYRYCLTQKAEYESCADMVLRYNAGLLLSPELIKED